MENKFREMLLLTFVSVVLVIFFTLGTFLSGFEMMAAVFLSAILAIQWVNEWEKWWGKKK